MKRAASVTAVACLLLGAGEASANGRYPASGQIALMPGHESTLLVRATYGLLFSPDAGKDWGWICEAAVGFGNDFAEDPMMAFTSNGTLLAGLFEGLAVGSTDACNWTFFGRGLASKFVVDLSIDKVTPSRGVLVISNSTGADDAGTPLFLTQLWSTADNGATWAQAGATLPTTFLGLTVDTAPSDPQRVYVSGFLQPNYVGVIERSDDRGATWQSLRIPGADMDHTPYIGAVDPTDPDVLYVRLNSNDDTLLASKDGGKTWATAFSATGTLNGFSLSPDGSTVAIGGPGVKTDGGPIVGNGLWTAPSSTLAFTQVSKVGALCLTWGKTGLYACGNEFVDGFTAGVSQDEGKTFTPLMHLNNLCGPPACAPSTSVGAQCGALWPLTQMMISATCPGADAGASSSSSSGSASGPSSTGGTPAPAKSSCACSLGADTAGGAAAALSALAIVVARSRRGKSRRRRG